MTYPYVSLKTGRPTVASAGWALERLQARPFGDEREALPESRHALERMSYASARLLQLFAGADYEGVLELNLASRPSFDPSIPPLTLVAVRLHVAANSEQNALEACLTQALILEPLLNRTWEGAEFRPIADREEYLRYFHPFTPGSCLRVERRTGPLSVAHPFASVTKGVLGFGGAGHTRPAKQEDQFVVEHCFPWVPSRDDWGLLLETLLSYPTPLWIQMRFASQARAEEAIRKCEETIKTCEHFLAGGHEVTLRAQVELLRNAVLDRVIRLRESALRGAVLLFAPGPADRTIGGLLGQSISGDITRGADANPYQGGFALASPIAQPRSPSGNLRPSPSQQPKPPARSASP